jgi:(S)-citramalyl-CoA lyase
MSQTVQARRSFIFSPGTDPSMYPKALKSGADIVCVELEDGVAPRDKAAARANMIAIFAEPQADDGVERIVRINALYTQEGRDDIAAILQADSRPPSLMLPKVNDPDEVAAVSDTLSELGLPTRLQVIIETCRGLEAASEIARASRRVDALLFGGVDLAADLLRLS